MSTTDPAEQMWLDVIKDADEANDRLEQAERVRPISSKREIALAEHETDKAEIDMLRGLYWLLDNGRLFGDLEKAVKEEQKIRSDAGLAMLNDGAVAGYDIKKLRIELRTLRGKIVKLVLAKAGLDFV